jgi:hypothetical protein
MGRDRNHQNRDLGGLLDKINASLDAESRGAVPGPLSRQSPDEVSGSHLPSCLLSHPMT